MFNFFLRCSTTHTYAALIKCYNFLTYLKHIYIENIPLAPVENAISTKINANKPKSRGRPPKVPKALDDSPTPIMYLMNKYLQLNEYISKRIINKHFKYNKY